jgi:hypothetical protein
MTSSLLRLLGVAGFTAVSLTAAHATGTLIPLVPISGSQTGSTTALAINDKDVIAGSWIDSDNTMHGFIGTLAGSYTSFDDPASGVTGTQARGINKGGSITGYASNNISTFILGYEFERNPNSAAITTVTEGTGKNKVDLDGIAQGITNDGQFAGDHFNETTFQRYAYYGISGRWVQDLTLTFNPFQAAARGINSSGTTVGYFFDGDGNQHGFILTANSTTQIDYPDEQSTGTALEGINDHGVVTGLWTDQNGNPHGFSYNMPTQTFRAMKVPGSTYVQTFGVNDNGYITVNSDVGTYIYCPHPAASCPNTAARAVTVDDSPAIHATASSVHEYVGVRKPAPTAENRAAEFKKVAAMYRAMIARLPHGAMIP